MLQLELYAWVLKELPPAEKEFLLSYCIFSQVLNLKICGVNLFTSSICLEAFVSLF